MRQAILGLREFYASPLGRVAREMVSRKVAEAWVDADGLDILALGYATPFLDGLTARARRAVAVMPAGQGVEAWPLGGPNRACLAHEAALPLANALFDRVLAVHALEESDDPVALLREVARVLAPSGRAILAVTARHGPWANAETTPFGHGRPFSRRQLEAAVSEADLEPMGWTRALYAPPLAWAARWAEGFERAGARLWPPFAGLILIEAAKQTFAARPVGERARPRALARPVFAPAPVQARAGRGLGGGRETVQPRPARNAQGGQGTP